MSVKKTMSNITLDEVNNNVSKLTTKVEEDVIGGFILTIENMQYDASVASSLRAVRKQLLQTR